MMKQIPATTNVSVASPMPAKNASSVIEFRKLNSGSIPSGGSQDSPSAAVCAEAGDAIVRSRVSAEAATFPTCHLQRLLIPGSWSAIRCLVSLTSVATDRSGLLLIAVFEFSGASEPEEALVPSLGSGWILTSIGHMRGFGIKYH